jgi:probable phosphoglycerate mutase
MLEIQSRFVRELELLRHELPEKTVAVFSHADPIKSVICYYLGVSLQNFQNLEVSPASLSTLLLSDWGAQLTQLNLVE